MIVCKIGHLLHNLVDLNNLLANVMQNYQLELSFIYISSRTWLRQLQMYVFFNSLKIYHKNMKLISTLNYIAEAKT